MKQKQIMSPLYQYVFCQYVFHMLLKIEKVPKNISGIISISMACGHDNCTVSSSIDRISGDLSVTNSHEVASAEFRCRQKIPGQSPPSLHQLSFFWPCTEMKHIMSIIVATSHLQQASAGIYLLSFLLQDKTEWYIVVSSPIKDVVVMSISTLALGL